MLYSGIDIHPKVSHCIVGTADGEIVKEEQIKSDKNEIKEFDKAAGLNGFSEEIYSDGKFLWVGTQRYGVNKIDLSDLKVEYYTY